MAPFETVKDINDWAMEAYVHHANLAFEIKTKKNGLKNCLLYFYLKFYIS